MKRILILILFSLSKFSFAQQMIPVSPPLGGFHIDGNLVANSPTANIGDWITGPGGTGGFVMDTMGVPLDTNTTLHIVDAWNGNDNIFNGGRTGDDPSTQWTWTTAAANTKTDINNVLFHFATDTINHHKRFMFAADRLSNTGISYVDFEFLQNLLYKNGNGTFTSAGLQGGRTVNDLLITAEYTGAGGQINFVFYRWAQVSPGLYDYVMFIPPTGSTYGFTSSGGETVPYGAFGYTSYSGNQFMEGAIDLSSVMGAYYPYFFLDDLDFRCLFIKTKVSTSASASLADFIDPILLCNFGFVSPNLFISPNLISGKLFADLNSNSVQDAGEQGIANRQVIMTYSNRIAFSIAGGMYNMSVFDTGTFTVSPTSPLNYYNITPANHPAYFSDFGQTDSLNDFAFQPAGVFNDLCVSISLFTPLRANRNATYMINYENIGTTTISPTVIFYIDTNVSFVSSIPVPSALYPDSVAWNFGPLAPLQSGSISVTVHVDAGTPVGTLIYGDVKIEPLAGDDDTLCNRDSWKTFTVASQDPNAIHVSRDTIFTTEISGTPELNYIIYFQNTGNDTAFHVLVRNLIDTSKLQIGTFEFVSSSHAAEISYKSYEKVFEFDFVNILLPDSNANEPGSHGFVRYKIKPKSTLHVSDSIKNTASIYFDFNSPVQTNVALTKVVQPSSIAEILFETNDAILYPNPSSNSFTILWKKKKGIVTISDVTGRVLYEQKLNNYSTTINQQWSPGIYFVTVSDGKDLSTQKMLIE
jgi:hypothetical protein